MEEYKYCRIYCSRCGKWLGTKRVDASTAGVYPFCPRCKKTVDVGVKLEPIEKSAKCQQH